MVELNVHGINDSYTILNVYFLQCRCAKTRITFRILFLYMSRVSIKHQKSGSDIQQWYRDGYQTMQGTVSVEDGADLRCFLASVKRKNQNIIQTVES